MERACACPPHPGKGPHLSPFLPAGCSPQWWSSGMMIDSLSGNSARRPDFPRFIETRRGASEHQGFSHQRQWCACLFKAVLAFRTSKPSGSDESSCSLEPIVQGFAVEGNGAGSHLGHEAAFLPIHSTRACVGLFGSDHKSLGDQPRRFKLKPPGYGSRRRGEQASEAARLPSRRH